MVSKECQSCGRKSYSSTTRGKWKCPYCGKEIKRLFI